MNAKQRGKLRTVVTTLCLTASSTPIAAQVPDMAATAERKNPISETEKSTSFEPMGIIRPFALYAAGDGDLKDVHSGMIRATAGRIRAFEDKAGASAGRIRAFAGEVSSFAGRIRAFSTDTTVNTSQNPAFWGTGYSKLSSVTASAGRIRAFDGDLTAVAGRIRAFAGRIRAFDGTLLSFAAGRTDYTGISQEISNMAAQGKSQWGSAIQSEGKTFETAFLNPVLSRWGVKLGDPATIAGLNEVDLELFLLDWRDNLLLYSGVNPIDHWMNAVSWSPRITQNMTSGADAPVKIGLIDFSVGGEQRANVALRGGLTIETGGHGTAVASLLVGSHDGKGVMGFAPRSKLYTYNPFDANYTADWSDIVTGLRSLGQQGVSAINLSLGVPGWTLHPEWRTVLGDSRVKSDIQRAVFVIAAGNDGITQTQNVNMGNAFDSTFLVVGSVDPNNMISEFSNKPGTVCLTDNGVCKNTARFNATSAQFQNSDYLKESGLLMNRFIVAPGEFMLVDDGQGGVTRVSGTSFATPLVSGTVALIGDRWPWLMDKPLDVAHIILSSATDLGEAGPDPVYGRGMLNVEAALAPLDWSKVSYRQTTSTGGTVQTSLATLRATSADTRSTWEASNAYFYVYENTTSSYRDFYVPMSSKLVGQTVGNNKDQMSWYLQRRFQAVLGAPSRLAGEASQSFGINGMNAPMAGLGGLIASVSLTPRTWQPGLRRSSVAFDTGVALGTPDGSFALRFGNGAGANVDGQRGFDLQSDYDVRHGGANPYLGLASGAGYVSADIRLTERLTVSAGGSSQTAQRDFDQLSMQDRLALGSLRPYQANASLLTVRYQATSWLDASASYTLLDEGTGLLGVQSLDRSDLRDGTVTDAVTLGAQVRPLPGLAVSLSGTMGRTRASNLDHQNMGVAEGGLISSAFQIAVAKTGVVDGHDRMRITLAQPLHVEQGRLAVNQFKVIDRQTGERGNAVETFDLQGGPRRFVAEALYGRSLFDGRAEFGMFGRADLRGASALQPEVVLGGSLRLGL